MKMKSSAIMLALALSGLAQAAELQILLPLIRTA